MTRAGTRRATAKNKKGMNGPPRINHHSDDGSFAWTLHQAIAEIEQERLRCTVWQGQSKAELRLIQFQQTFYCEREDRVTSRHLSLLDAGRELALHFGTSAVLNYSAVSWMSRLIITVYDVHARRRYRCREAVTVLLHPRCFPASVPRDIRGLLARLVWDTKVSNVWDDVPVENFGKSRK